MDQLNLPNTAFGPAIGDNPRGGTLVAGSILSPNVCPQLGVMPWAESGGLVNQDRLELFPELTSEHLAGALGGRGLEHAALRIPGQSRPVQSVVEDITEFPLAELPVDYPGLRHVIHFAQPPDHDGENIRIRYRAATNIAGLTPHLQKLTAQAEADGDSIPLHMDGGLCFYHPTKRHNTVGLANYMTGKIAELARPYLQNLDADGELISHHWGEWDLSEWESSKTLVKVIAASAIDTAAASWAIDVTLGYTAMGAGIHEPMADLLYTFGDTANTSGWLATESVDIGKVVFGTNYDCQSGGVIEQRVGIYQDDTATLCDLLASSEFYGRPHSVTTISSSKFWNEYHYSGTRPAIVSGEKYRPAFATPSSSIGFRYDTVTGQALWRKFAQIPASDPLPDPLYSSLPVSDLQVSAYLEFAEGDIPAVPFSRNRFGDLSGYSRGRFGGR